MTRLYHAAVFAPEALFRSPGVVRLRYSRHARNEAYNDRYADLTRYLTPYMDYDAAEIIEVELDAEGQICKRVARFPIADDLALVVVACSEGYVRTVWANEWTDNHFSLDRSRYVQPPRIAAHA